MPRDQAKVRANRRRYSERQKVAKYGPEAAGIDMRGRHGNHATGPRNGRWKGGRKKDADGYVLVRVPRGHHRRMSTGYAFEHDLVAEKKIGRKMLPHELAHHRDGVRDNNDPANLEVETRSNHSREHAKAPGIRNTAGQFVAGRKRGRLDMIREAAARLRQKEGGAE